jgi:hypothetical protein
MERCIKPQLLVSGSPVRDRPDSICINNTLGDQPL